MNYNDLQRMKPYYNTMNYRYNDNIPKALPLIRNNRLDHSNITVAPPIPSYYKQNINSTNYYSHLPNIMNVTYSSAEKIAKNFSNNLNNLRNLEEQIAEGNRVYNLPKLNQTQNDIDYQNMLKSKANEKMENGMDDEDIKNKINQMRQEAGRIPDYKTEEQKKILQNKEIMSEEGINTFNKNLISSLQDYSNNIQKSIQTKNTNDDLMYDMIKEGITSLKEDFSKRIERFNKQSKDNMDKMRKLMENSTNPRLKLLSEHLFSTSDIDEMLRLREKNKKKNLIDNRRMSEIMLKGIEEAKIEHENNQQAELKKAQEEEEEKKKIVVVKNPDEIEKIPLDLWEKKRALAIRGDNAISKKVISYGSHYFELQPLNRFRSYVFSVMAARRILNIKYTVYKEFKFNAVSYYINNYEDMDIILKKLVYNTVKDPLLEILNNTDMNINLTYDTEDNHETYFLLQDYIQRILNNFNTRFFLGISGEMCNYLALYVTNYSFIPKDFFTTFELVRIRTTETGEFIELNNENRKMILTFYIFIKILLRNIFLELMFNQADRKKLSLNPKLNIKMVVSVLYRSIIKFLVKNCVTRTNLQDLENAEDMTAFLKIKYSKREFHLHRFLKKRYFLKVSEVEEQPKRVSRRTRKIVSPKSSSINDSRERKIRETMRVIDEKKKKEMERIAREKEDKRKKELREEEDKKREKENRKQKKSENSITEKTEEEKSGTEKTGSEKTGTEQTGTKKTGADKNKKDSKKSKNEEEESDEEEEEESDSEENSNEKKTKDKKTDKTKKSENKKSSEKSGNKKDESNKENDKKSGSGSEEKSGSGDDNEEEEEESDSEDSSAEEKKGRGR